MYQKLREWLGLAEDPVKIRAAALYLTLVQLARHPRFYTEMKVPDTLDGRFEMIILHTSLVISRLYELQAKPLADALFDHMFADFDRSLREMGVGDLGVGKRIRKMGEAFYGRARVYTDAIKLGRQSLTHALDRNLYGTKTIDPPTADAMAGYVLQFIDRLKHMNAEDIICTTNW